MSETDIQFNKTIYQEAKIDNKVTIVSSSTNIEVPDLRTTMTSQLNKSMEMRVVPRDTSISIIRKDTDK